MGVGRYSGSVRTLLVDNHDSYTFNLYQLIADVTGRAPRVLANDDPRLARLEPGAHDVAVISPGPGHPAVPRDVGQVAAVLASGLPVLGVCLGHQAIALAGGAQVGPAPVPRHGHLTRVRHGGSGLFEGLPPDFIAVRYHSLRVGEPLPPDLEALAWAEDGVLMALRHRTLPHWGVQFHPESIGTSWGRRLLQNFYALAAAHRPSLRAHVLELDGEADLEALHADRYAGREHSFWLDSAAVRTGTSRFSFLGAPEGPAGEVLTFRAGEDSVLVEPVAGPPRRDPGTIFEVLAGRLDAAVTGADGLPFELAGGYVGYFGYELKALLGFPVSHRAETPDAVWLRADRFVAVDHAEHRSYLVAVADAAGSAAAEAWLRELAAAVPAPPPPAGAPAGVELPVPDRSRERYLADIAECRRQLIAGESYEICLTGTFRGPAPADDAAFYRRLRRLNPAPYGALLRSGDLAVFSSSPERFLRVGRGRTVESRPIKGTSAREEDRDLDARRAAALAADPKARAENLMIVDLLRNDLGRVCEIGSVEVPSFLEVETHATVHQLVSTVRGRLAAGVTTLDAVRSCFPGGSMTGAPKERTMEIIDRLEDGPRGVYSGALGWLAFGGAADLSIVIRTAVRLGAGLSVGAGGAIVLASDPEAEYEEVLLKAAAVTRALEGQDPLT